VNAAFDPLGALILVAWLAAGGYAVSIFLRQPQRTFRHWVSLIAGLVMLTLGVGCGGLGLYGLWRLSH